MCHEHTSSEELLWRVLRRKQLGVRFRRQVVLQGYVTDFYAASIRLIVEVDGAYHAKRSQAEARCDHQVTACGYRVLHVTVEEALASLAAVVKGVQAVVGA